MWGVICLLKCTWPVNFFFHFVKTSRFPRNLVHKKRDSKVFLFLTWRGNFSKKIRAWNTITISTLLPIKKPGTYSALVSFVIWFRTEANEYIELIRRYPPTWRRSSFVAWWKNLMDINPTKKSHCTIKRSIKLFNWARMKIFVQDLCSVVFLTVCPIKIKPACQS